jgi:flagellar hook-associated protein 1 FlgK
MSSFLNTSISGLLAFQKAIDTTSHNIANVGTAGYSRQRTEFATRQASPFGNGYIGNGVAVSTTRRIYDDLLAEEVRSSSSSFGNIDAYAKQMEKLSTLFSNTTTGMTASLQKFAAALQDVANNPSSVSSRQVLLSEANGLTERLKNYETQLASYDAQIESTIKAEAADLTALSKGIADLNQQISAAFATAGQPPNDLLDQRDRLLDELASHIDVNTVTQGDGQINVFIGNGQPLVVGNAGATVSLTTDPFDPNRHGLAISSSGTSGAVDITKSLSGGSLGGVLDYRNNVLDSTRNQLGRISVALTSAVNEQHRAGIDLNGQLGGDFFGLGGVQTLPSSQNTGSGTVSVTRSDVGALTDGDYFLTRTGSGWSLQREDTGGTIPMTGTGTVADPFVADGLSFVVGGAAATGDRFLIRPTRGATSGMSVLVKDPAAVAAASPIRTNAASSNTGNGAISAGTVLDPTNAALRNNATITFTSATTYSINGGANINYTPGQPITANGWQVEITGSPAVGDSFTVGDNSSGAGDNRNAQLLSEALGSPILDGGTTSVNDAVNRVVGNIGVVTRQAQSSRDAQEIVKQEAIDARDSVSGVNLDEEAANLIKYQQAYQAAAQLIGVAQSLFDSILAATRR